MNWISVKDNDESVHEDKLVKLNNYLIKLNVQQDTYEAVYWTGYEFHHEDSGYEYTLAEVSHYMPIQPPED
jgi:hypothetical protein